jgi:hypothetical protein
MAARQKLPGFSACSCFWTWLTNSLFFSSELSKGWFVTGRNPPYHLTALSFLKTQRHISPVRFRPYYERVCPLDQLIVFMSRPKLMTLLLLISIFPADLCLKQHALWGIFRFDKETGFLLCRARLATVTQSSSGCAMPRIGCNASRRRGR